MLSCDIFHGEPDQVQSSATMGQSLLELNEYVAAWTEEVMEENLIKQPNTESDGCSTQCKHLTLDQPFKHI